MIVEKAVQIISNPLGFFDSLEEYGIKDSYVYYIVLSIFSTILSAVLGMVLQGSQITSLFSGMPLMGAYFALGIGLVFWVVSLVTVFVFAGTLHVITMIFGARVPYSKSMQTYVYSFTPLYAISWLPYLGFIAGLIWSVVLLILALPRTHGLSATKSVFATIVYLILAFIFILLLFAISFFILFFGFAGLSVF